MNAKPNTRRNNKSASTTTSTTKVFLFPLCFIYFILFFNFPLPLRLTTTTTTTFVVFPFFWFLFFTRHCLRIWKAPSFFRFHFLFIFWLPDKRRKPGCCALYRRLGTFREYEGRWNVSVRFFPVAGRSCEGVFFLFFCLSQKMGG